MASRAKFPMNFLFLCSILYLSSSSFCHCSSSSEITLDSLRISLENQEDFIVFSLIERARYPYNSPAYETFGFEGQNFSFVEIYVRETEAMEAKFGRYQNPEELPFFPNDIEPQLVPSYKFSQFLNPSGSSVNASESIWDMYFNELLPLITKKGYDGNYEKSVESDLICLQALSKRINTGRFVAEVKFRADPQIYTPYILAKDSETLTNLVTTTSVEESVVKRVFKKAEIFGQEVNLQDNETVTEVNGNGIKYKVDPSIASRLYKEWVIPLTKRVEVDYLLRRLD